MVDDIRKYGGVTIDDGVWDALVDHGLKTPERYQVYKSGATTKARSSVDGKVDHSDTDARKVLQDAMDAVASEGGTGHIKLHTGSVYEIDTSLTLKCPLIGVERQYSETPSPYERRQGPVLKATAVIDMIILDGYTDPNMSYFTTIRNIDLDMNNLATTGIKLSDSWYSDVKATIRNIKAGAIGLDVRCDHDGQGGCYYNRFWMDIRGSSKAAGSIGVRLGGDASNPLPNFNNFSGLVQACDLGVKIEKGDQQDFDHFDASSNNTGYDVDVGTAHVFKNCYAEGNTNYGFDLATGVNIIIIGGYRGSNGVDINLSGSAKALIFGSPTAIALWSKYNAGVGYNTPPIMWTVAGNYSITFDAQYDGPMLNLKNTSGKIAARIYVDADGRFSIYRANDEYELGTFKAGTAQNRPVFKLWDVTLNAYRYVYLDNGAWVVSAVEPT